jgi:crescentin
MDNPAGLGDVRALASQQDSAARDFHETYEATAAQALWHAADDTAVLDATGRQAETLRLGVSQVLDRFDEIARLKETFSSLVADPLMTLVADYPRVRAQLLEAVQGLNRERQVGADLRGELRELKITYEKLADAFAVLNGQHQHATQAAREHEGRAASLSITLREHEQRTGELERQLAAETDRSRAVSEELQNLRREAQQADATVARFERDLAETREALEILQFDGQALRTTCGEQAQRLGAFETRQAELEQQLRVAHQETTELQAKLDAEHGVRKKLDAQLEAERSNARGEMAAQEMKLEGLASRMTVTDKILTQTREQLRDKTEELKAAERGAREALAEKSAFERRLEAVGQELQRQSALATGSKEARTELEERCEMLTKAIAAKDGLLQRADNRAGMLLERIDQLTRRFDEERSAFEAKNKQLWEDLQREKSERALTQGALETARRSRIEAERALASLQNERQAVADVKGGGQHAAADALAEDRSAATNVMPFKPSDG